MSKVTLKKTIWGNTIVKNEGKFIWFAVMSVIDHLDKMIIWDTGSSDNTVNIIKQIQKIKKDKIIFKEYGLVDEIQFTKARQEMLDQTKSDWVFILDGDEVWWDDSIKKIIETINIKKNLELIVTPFYSIVGDIYHHQENSAGRYHLMGKSGHLNIRAINKKIPGLHLERPYGQEGYFDDKGKLIQDRNSSNFRYLGIPYMHFSNIQRSNSIDGDNEVMQRKRKIKFEIGESFPKDFKHPDIFYKSFPEIVPSPWIKMPNTFKLKASLQTPLRKIKRVIIK